MEIRVVGGHAISGDHGVIVVEHCVARCRFDAALGDHAGVLESEPSATALRRPCRVKTVQRDLAHVGLAGSDV